MPLYRLADFDPNYQETFGGDDIKALEVYTEGGQKVGAVADVLVDQDGRFRYVVVDTHYDLGAKKVLLPVGLSHIDYNAKRVYVDGLSREQVERLPEYQDRMVVDHDYEEKVRGTYRPTSTDTTQDSSFYDLNEQNHQTFKLYQERLIASKTRVKAGEVTVGKHIETETARVAVPIEKERVVIERVVPTVTDTIVDPNTVQFQEGEVARIEVYEETPDIRKEAFVREEVRVKKVVDQEIVETEETVRREELDVKTDGNLPIA